ncbi:MAG: AraC family transcriptional regulator, partial [Oscillospiraceae bacterium]
IKSHYQTELSVAEVSRAVGISREYFCMLFKRQFSISPVRYIREYRLKTASMLLLTTRDSIAVIAEKVGFHDYNYFTNQFTRHFGVSPTGYRKAGLDISIKSP